MTHRKIIQIVLATFATLLVGVVVYMVARPRVLPPELRRQPPPWGTAQEHTAVRSAVPQIDPHQVDDLSMVVRRSITVPERGAGQIDDNNVESLSRVLQRYIEAMTSDSAEAYMAIVDSESTTWIDRSNEQWIKIDAAWDFLHKSPANRQRPRETLRELMQYHRFGKDNRFVRVGTGEHGMRVEVEIARSSADFLRPLIYERSGPKEQLYWTGGGNHQMRFREPRVSADQIVRKHSSVVFAQASVILSTEENRAAAWLSTWYWDPDAKEWLNASNAIESFYGFAMFY